MRTLRALAAALASAALVAVGVPPASGATIETVPAAGTFSFTTANGILPTWASEDIVIVGVSRDLPFALKRWCAAEGMERVVTLSDYKHRSFGKQFGVELPDLGLLARALFVIDKSGKVAHVDYVTEVAEEPDYQAALAAVKRAL